jgi:beta-glucosidase
MASDDDATTLVQLTLAEKASLCLGSDMWHTAAVERLGIPSIALSDGPHGLRRMPDGGDHVGLSGSLPATCFPTASALGSSWDTALAGRVGTALAAEARAQDVAVVLGPGINIKRSPLCGRNFEYLSEDPMLSGRLAAALIEGVQAGGVGTSLKHFAANNQETDRLRVSAEIDERTLREIYLTGFEIAVTTARPWTLMCAYNRINGTHASQHEWLLTSILRNEWGFDGLVMSDWGAVHDRVAALAAGLDLEMPPNLGVSDVAIIDAVRSGHLDEAVLDTAVRRVLQLVRRATGGSAGRDEFDVDAHHALARDVARDCAVLLKNESDSLPLQLSSGQTLAVIGEFARTPRFQGAGSSQVNPTRVDNPLDELRAAAPDGVDVAFAAGFTLNGNADNDATLAEEAIALAARADNVVVFCGLPGSDESEGYDRVHMRLPANQTTLLPRLAAANPQLVVVLANGSAVQVADWEPHVAAILETWLSGQAAGGATADLLFGLANPNGRLAETMPLRLEDNSSYLNFPGEDGHVRYGEGIFVGYRGYDACDQQVSYPFGHGLSYTTFDYSDLEVSVAEHAAVSVSCTVTNTGPRRGKEVVQLYVGDLITSVARPRRELKTFAKVDLEPGASEVVHFSLAARDFSFWSTRRRDWHLESGAFEIAVGASSRDLRLRMQIELESAQVPLPLDEMSTLDEWLADSDAAAALRKALDDGGVGESILENEEMKRLIGNFPISSLAAFPGHGLNHEVVRAVIDQRRALER